MARRGRVVAFVGWFVLGIVCLAGAGCTLTINTGYVKPPPPVDRVEPVPAAPPEQDSGLQPVSLRDDGPVKPPEQAPMPSSTPAPMPTGEPRMTPGCPGCLDANVALHPDMQKGYHDAAAPPTGFNPLPKEKQMTTHPPYIVEAPDILLIDTSRLVPRHPYIIQPLDGLVIQVANAFKDRPINGAFTVGIDGTVDLGLGYGRVRVGGKTLEQARRDVIAFLAGRPHNIQDPQVSLGLLAIQTAQQIRGEHLVRADGTISLGVYGCVYIAGMNMCQAQTVIEQHLSRFFQDPEISLDVFAYNSKVYYVVVDGGGYGMQVVRFPITGNETVLDAIERLGGIPAVGSRRRIWVARPTPANAECVQVLPVDWLAIVQSGSTRTNYQLFPGDRVYIKADPLIALDNMIAKIVSPIERIFGVTLLGSAVVNSFHNNGNRNGNNGGFIFGTGF